MPFKSYLEISEIDQNCQEKLHDKKESVPSGYLLSVIDTKGSPHPPHLIAQQRESSRSHHFPALPLTVSPTARIL